MLIDLAVDVRIMIESITKELLAKEAAARRAKCEAFAMGHLERLGEGSRVRWLDAGVVRMVLKHLEPYGL